MAAATTVPVWVRALAAAYGLARPSSARIGGSPTRSWRRSPAGRRRGLLARGVGRGGRVGLLLGNSPDWVIGFCAAARIGAVAVPLSTFYRDRELACVIRHADLHGLVVHRRFLGDDIPARVAGALGDLDGAGDGPLVLRSAPFLRWVVALDDGDRGDADAPPAPAWAHDRQWLVEAADGPFDDALLAEVEAEVHAGDEAIMIYTSGSTADAKGVPHPQEVVLRKTHHLVGALGIEPDARSYVASPFFWVGGLTMSLLPVLDQGGTQFVTDRFDAGEVLRLVEDERLTKAVLYPHHVEAILGHPAFATTDRSSLRDANPSVLAPGQPPFSFPDGMVSGLGMTETFAGYWWGRPELVPDRPLRPGERRPPPMDRLLPGMEMKVVAPDGTAVGDGERGELCLRGWTVMRGLHKVDDRSALFDADGFFHTGDEVEVDGDRVRFRGRLGGMIKTAGANVSPDEVADVLQSHPTVAAAHVVPLDDPVRGQVVAAAVVAADGATVQPEELRAFARTQLSTYKVPAHVLVVTADEVPWTASHKVRRGALAELVAARLAAADPT